MLIYRPIKTNRKTQAFGENRACINPITRKIITKANEADCPSGYHSLYGSGGHNGEDWATGLGEQLLFPVIVPNMTWHAKNEVDIDGGIGVDVISDEKVTLRYFDVDGVQKTRTDYLKFRFWHLLSSAIADNEPVEFGTLLGYCDSTGRSTGHHLHWSVKWCQKDGRRIIDESTQGTYGAWDFSPFFINRYVKTVQRLRKLGQEVLEESIKETNPPILKTALLSVLLKLVDWLLGR